MVGTGGGVRGGAGAGEVCEGVELGEVGRGEERGAEGGQIVDNAGGLQQSNGKK